MSLKLLHEESELLDEVNPNITVPSYIERLSMVIRSEEDAIKEYDVLLDETDDFPEELRSTIKEIQNDEKDHLILLTNALQRYSNDEYPNNTEELDELPYPEDSESEDLELKVDED